MVDLSAVLDFIFPNSFTRHKANEQSKQNLVTETEAESVNVRGLRSEFSGIIYDGK